MNTVNNNYQIILLAVIAALLFLILLRLPQPPYKVHVDNYKLDVDVENEPTVKLNNDWQDPLYVNVVD